MASSRAESTSSKQFPAELLARERCFTYKNHEKDVLAGFNETRIGGSLCDVKLIVDECEFDVHRVVLTACSPYFREMFTSEVKESDENVIVLRGINATVFQHVLNFVYLKSSMYLDVLDVQSIKDILSAAKDLQISSVITSCCEFMQSKVNLENCSDIHDIAKYFSLTEVEDFVLNFILAHFSQFSRTGKFLQLSEDYLCKLLSSNNMKGYELDLFHAANRWLLYDTSRLQNVYHIMKYIKFQLMHPMIVGEYVYPVNFTPTNALTCNDKCIDDCMDFLREFYMYHASPYKQPLRTSPRMCVRSATACLVALGRRNLSTNSVTTDIQICDRETEKWLRLAEMRVPSYCYCVAVLNDFMFVVGGQNEFNGTANSAKADMYRYDPRLNTWFRLASMLEPRTEFAVSVIDDFLYHVAGRNKTGSLSSAEKYSVADNKWEPIAHLLHPLYQHASATCNRRMYVSGGRGGYALCGFQRELRCYEPSVDKWESKPELKTERALHCMVAYKERLYCIGGSNKINGMRRDVLRTEMFDINAEQWTDVAPHFTEQGGADAALVEGKIYVVGGHSRRERKSVHVACYNPDKDEWEKALDLPEASSRMACCALKIPSTLLSEGGYKWSNAQWDDDF